MRSRGTTAHDGRASAGGQTLFAASAAGRAAASHSGGESWLKRILVAGGERDDFSDGGSWSWQEPDDARRSWRLKRPSLPPLFFVAFPLWLAVAITIDALFGQQVQLCRQVAMVAGAAVLVSLLLLCARIPLIGCIALGISLGCLIASLHAAALVDGRQALLASDASRDIEVVSDARAGDFGCWALARVEGGPLVRLTLPEGVDALVGDCYTAQVAWREPAEKVALARWREGVVATGNVQTLEALPASPVLRPIRDFRRRCIGELERCGMAVGEVLGFAVDDASLMLAAVVLGHGGGMYASELYQAVKVDGLAHLVAVSGAHLAIVCGIVGMLIRRLPLARAAGIVLQLLIVGGYLVLTGAPASAVRAAIMACLGLLAFFPARRPYALGALSLCVALMLARDPAAAFSLSFTLSVAATVGIVLFCGFFTGMLQQAMRLPPGAVCDSLAVTAAASFITMPVSACCFGQLSAIAPLSNLIAAPAFPVICLGGFLALAAAVAVPPGGLVLSALLVAIELFCRLLEALSHIPFAACPVALGPVEGALLAVGLPALVWIAWPRPRVRIVVGAFGLAGLALVGCLAAPAIRGDTITMLDVGQGDAVLVQSRGCSLLIDTGTQDVALLEGLASCGALSLDAVLITHPDDDHCGSLAALRGIVGVGHVLVAHDLLAIGEAHCAALRASAARLVGDAGIIGLSVGERIEVGAFRFTVIGPDALEDDGGNGDSLVLRMDYDGDGDGVDDLQGLFTGDAEAAPVERYVAAGRVGDIALLKVPHHGSRASVDPALLATLRPELSIISVGANNRYGHPAPEALAALESCGSAVFRTDTQGAIRCHFSPTGISVHATH